MTEVSVLSPVTAVLRADGPVDHAPVIEVLAAAGLVEIELTLTTPGALEALPELRRRFGDSVKLGMGTVTSAELARAAVSAGAQFLVTPGVLPAVAAAASTHRVPIVMGALTPTEVMAAQVADADLVKIFPASIVGPGYLGQLRGPFPDLRAIPSGGIGPDEAAAWLRAGAARVCMGGPLIGDALSGGPISELRRRIRRTTEALLRAQDCP